MLKEFVDKRRNKQGFPENYCNVASAELAKELSKIGKKTTKHFTYKKIGEGHTFLKDEEGNIIDPTYGQYDPKYKDGFQGKEFPDIDLERNQTTPEKFLELQKKRNDDGVYNK